MLRTIFRRLRTATKPQLAEISGLSVVTVNALVKALMNKGEVIEDLLESPQLGRPALRYRFHEQHQLTLVVFMHEKEAKDTVFFSVCNLYGEILTRKQISFDEITLEGYFEPIEQLLKEYPKITLMEFGMPAQQLQGKLIGDYPALQGIDFCSEIQTRFQLPVRIENDINAAVFGYCLKHPEKSVVTAIYFPQKYPPGVGICIDGKLFKGSQGLAGEIKYLPLGVHWEQFDFRQESLQPIILDLLRSCIALYNPDTIVLYQECSQKIDYSALLRKNCIDQLEQAMIPEIILSDELNRDFENGLIQLSLSNIFKESFSC